MRARAIASLWPLPKSARFTSPPPSSARLKICPSGSRRLTRTAAPPRANNFFMPPAATTKAPLMLVYGDDEFAVKQRARQIFQQWSTELGGMDHEIIDAQVSNSGEALKAIGRLR